MKYIFLLFLLSFLMAFQTEAKICASLVPFTRRDTVCNVWIFFTDKKMSVQGNKPICKRALARRKAAGFISSGDEDLPLNDDYLKDIKALGGKLRHLYKWENAASFSVSAKRLEAVSRLSFVEYIQPVNVFRGKENIDRRVLAKRVPEDTSIYGLSFNQLSMAAVTQAHDYMLRLKKKAAPGQGVIMAFFDSGFRLGHKCFEYVRKNNSITATWDFIDNDTSVFDPDSVCSDSMNPYFTNDYHGSSVFGLVAGYDPGTFMGAAWGAQFVLARTEDTYLDGYMEREVHVEEDNWVAALVWAESLGVDIVSSSLGYRDGFEDSVIIERDGKYESVSDYAYCDLDGKTTIVSRAASMAVKRGLIIVSAVGNEGSSSSGTLCAPADGDGVIAVGSVDPDGSIAWFSSTGPTYDGRIKPDLVTQGTKITVPLINNSTFSQYSTFGSGTSFSTPFVSGICALIMQSHPVLEPSQIRSRLYKYCSFLTGQNNVDNKYGRGLPNALLSCMQDDEVYVQINDTSGLASKYVLIENSNGDSLGLTDYNGTGIISVKNTPANLGLVFSGKRQTLFIDSTPAFKEIFIDDDSSGVIVSLRNKLDHSIEGKVFFRIEGEDNFLQQETDESGNIKIGYYKEVPADIYAIAPGYKTSDTIKVMVGSDLYSEILLLEEIPVSRFCLYPTVIKRDNSLLKVNFLTETGKSQSRIRLSVRSVDGTLVWKENRYMEPEEPFEFEWDCCTRNGIRMVPGVYFMIIECNGKVYRKKFLISE